MHLHNWRHDVVAIINSDGQVKERITYDAYGRPHCFSPGDVKGGGGAGNDRPDGLLNSSDTWTTGSVVWNKDLGNSSNVAIPDGSVTSADGTTLTNLKSAGFSGGYGILSSSAVDNRRGFAGYEFDPILEGSATANNKPVYHVRHRVLASDTGKWFQKDPLGYIDGMDLYEYCMSDPEDLVDSNGLVASASTTCTDCSVVGTGSTLANKPQFTASASTVLTESNYGTAVMVARPATPPGPTPANGLPCVRAEYVSCSLGRPMWVVTPGTAKCTTAFGTWTPAAIKVLMEAYVCGSIIRSYFPCDSCRVGSCSVSAWSTFVGPLASPGKGVTYSFMYLGCPVTVTSSPGSSVTYRWGTGICTGTGTNTDLDPQYMPFGPRPWTNDPTDDLPSNYGPRP